MTHLTASSVLDSGTATPPLQGLRIIDISTYVAGPSAGMTLAQLGADVIRVDPMGGAADTRRLPLDGAAHSLYWAGLNKGKRSVELDLASPEGRELVLGLLAAPGPDGGILLTNATAQPWMAYDALRARRSDLIQVHIGGRPDGRSAVDYTVNCEVGLPSITGPIDALGPVNHVLPAWDLLAGLHAALAILTAERVRARTGQGQLIRLSLADVAVATMAHLGFVADVVVNGRSRDRDGNYLYGSFGCDFPTSDGRRVMIAALTRRHWEKLISLTGVSGAVGAIEKSLGVDLGEEESRYQYREMLAALIRPWFAQRTLAEVTSNLEAHRILWGQYRNIEELVGDPDSLLHVGDLMANVKHPGTGVYPTPRPVLDFTGWTTREASIAPAFGSHTDEVLKEVLGLSDTDLADLRSRGVIGGEAV